MKKQVQDFVVRENLPLSERIFLLKLSPSDGSLLVPTRAGQFVEVRVDGDANVFLRRPISIHFIDESDNTLWLLIQKAGKGTERLSKMTEGEIINLIYPLGNGFTLPVIDDATDKHILLIGGGVGVAPLLQTGAVLKKMGAKVSFLLGGRTIADLVQLQEYAQYGDLYITTEDGSVTEGAQCQKGFVTNHTVFSEGMFDAIRVCGPMPMMKAVAKTVSQWKEMQKTERFCEVSLENKMACGLGVCLCCVEDTKEGHKCVCSEGPVFDINDLNW